MVRTSRNLQYVAVVLAAMVGDLSCANARGGRGQAVPPSVGSVQPNETTDPSIRPAELIRNAAKKPRSQRRKILRRILRVGPKRKLRVPSQAARIARTGDHIKIDAGEYRDCAVWRANDLILEGVGGYAHVRDVSCKEEGIWVVRADRTTVINIEFSGAHVTANNGAGIKFTGRILIVRNSYFHDNENGIMGGTKPDGQVLISNSRFERNGKCEPVCAHGIYIGRIRKLRIIGSIFTGQKVGHHIKSRARYTEIVGNRITDGATGTASFLINLPNGGTAVIRSNYLQKGPRAQNHMTMIAIGEEGAPNPSRGILIERNVFRNDNPKLKQFVWNRSKQLVTMRANHFQGNGKHLKGPGRIKR